MTRDRGSYGPLDRERNWVAGWTVDQAVDYARDHTIGAALRPVMPVVSDVFKAGHSAQRVWTAARGIGGRTEAEKSPTQIGHELFHTFADRDRAIAQISTGFHALTNDLSVWLSTNKSHPDASTIARWIATDVTPMLAEWSDFVAHENKSMWVKIATSWETLEQWWGRLKQLRSLARVHGVMLQSAELTPLPKTIWQRSSEGKGSEATAVLGVLKIGALTALGIMGVAGLFGAVRNLHAKAQGTQDHAAVRAIVREELRGEK